MAAHDPALANWFNQVDADRSGHISAGELQQALRMGSLNFSLALCARLIRLYDTDASKSISFAEFQQLHGFLVSCQASFRHFDADRSGNLSANEVYQALQHSGFRLEQPAFQAMFTAWDPDCSGNLGMDEFIAACIFLRSVTKVFSAFDAQRTGRVTLTFDQAIYFCSHCC